MRPEEIRILSDEQVEETLDELREEWRQHRFDQAVGRLQKTRRIRQIRRDIARLLTIRTERAQAREIEELIGSNQPLEIE